MRFMIIVKSGGGCESGAAMDEKFVAEMRKFNDDLAQAGVLLALEGLHPSAQGARVRLSAGKQTVVDGPFAETKELIGGYWLWQTKSKNEAIEWVRRCPIRADAEAEIEIRQVLDAEEFSARLAPSFYRKSQRVPA